MRPPACPCGGRPGPSLRRRCLGGGGDPRIAKPSNDGPRSSHAFGRPNQRTLPGPASPGPWARRRAAPAACRAGGAAREDPGGPGVRLQRLGGLEPKTACSRPCAGGRRSRTRRVESSPGGAAPCSDREEAPCGVGETCPGSPCMDEPHDWQDPSGDDCFMYEWGELCTFSMGYGAGWRNLKGGKFKDHSAPDGVTALEACCACGGGAAQSRPKATQSAE
uniref:Uncharacterized protein n=1 Tax=Alexandrium monilatum TaxID=311494 RepID=A0A7S4Q6G2_9DINO|mmetsp:Transcript_6593/g.20391  ORF Transcript_6593/g.20391 Transcript_6593/m.20391 type:complete len:220 (-) Transcript_6593:200-859(-)